EAEHEHRLALGALEKLVADFPTEPRYRQQLARSQRNLAVLLDRLGKVAAAEQQFRRVLTTWENLSADFPGVPQYRQDLAASHISMGICLDERGKFAAAEEQYQRAFRMLEKLVVEYPTVVQYRQNLARGHNNLAILLVREDKHAQAEQQYRLALGLWEKLASDHPAVPQYRQDLADARLGLAGLLVHRGKRAEANQQSRKALALLKKLAADFPAVPTFRIELGGNYCNYGNVLNNSGQPRESLEWYTRAIQMLTPVYEREHRQSDAGTFLRNSYWNRALAYDRLKQYPEAIKDWDRAIDLSPKSEQPKLRTGRAITRIQAGQVTDGVAEVAELMKSSRWSPERWYDFACAYAVASAVSPDKKKQYADRAMELLHQAVKAGWRDAAQLSKDTDLAPLRQRDDFKKLIQELKKTTARPEKRP
ncbi:MAG TPA: tetratricopeptide repeat protein, partial [Gemmataceae bacterium]|nr:tetratricopeptide repeat protein [Gemmataceae bacterium]